MIDTSGVNSASKDVELARRIAEYWRNKGYNVDVRVRHCGEPIGQRALGYHAVRSNLRAGLPLFYKRSDALHA